MEKRVTRAPIAMMRPMTMESTRQHRKRSTRNLAQHRVLDERIGVESLRAAQHKSLDIGSIIRSNKIKYAVPPYTERFDELCAAYDERGIKFASDLVPDYSSSHNSSAGRQQRRRRAVLRSYENNSQSCGRVVSDIPTIIHKRPMRNVMFEQFIDAHPKYRADAIHGKYYVQESNVKAKAKHLDNFMGEPTPINEDYYDSLSIAFRFMKRFFPQDAIVPIDSLPVTTGGLDPTSGPGLSYKTNGYKNKGEAFYVAIQDATSKMARLLNGERVVPGCYWAGGRGKRCANNDTEKTLTKGRLIWMPECDDTILQNVTLRELTTLLTLIPGPWSIGDSNFYNGSASVACLAREGYTYGVYPDYTRFDGSVIPELAALGITLLRACFKNGQAPQYDTYWTYIKESCMEGFICMPTKVIHHADKGMKSGHTFTSLLESVINALAVYTVLAEMLLDMGKNEDTIIVELEKFFIKAMGDDSTILGCERHRALLRWERFDYHLRAAFSIEISKEKTFDSTAVQCDYDDLELANGSNTKRYKFLGKSIYNDHQWRPYDETVAMLLYPEYPTNTWGEELYVCHGHFYDCGNSSTQLMLYDYAHFIVERTDHVVKPHALGLRIPSVEIGSDIDRFLSLGQHGTAGGADKKKKKREN
jgi:hypothetical protein